MAKRKTILTGFEYREASHTRKIHVFDVIGYNRAKNPICGFDVGPLTFPLSPDEVGPIDGNKRICKACLNRSSGVA